jgi:NAD(P) transhydrogenase
VIRGEGRVTDPNTVEVVTPEGDVQTLCGRHLLVATGSSPVRPPDVDSQSPLIVDAEGVLALERLPSSMLIVGGGVIGLEYAAIFAEIGVEVTVVHHGSTVLPFVDAECRQHLLRAMRNQGVRFLFQRKVRAANQTTRHAVRVIFDDGESRTADVLLWAAGHRGNTDGIGLDEVGVRRDERGLIVVDDHYRTSVDSIYAAGDVIGFPALASTSMEQGRIASCHMFGIDFERRLSATMPIGLYTIPEVSMVGMTVEQAESAGHDVVVGRAYYRYNVRGRMLGDEEGILKTVFDGESRTLLGVTCVGEDAIELIHVAQCAIHHGAGIDYFINACFNYPSLSELYKHSAYAAQQEIAGRANLSQSRARVA